MDPAHAQRRYVDQCGGRFEGHSDAFEEERVEVDLSDIHAMIGRERLLLKMLESEQSVINAEDSQSPQSRKKDLQIPSRKQSTAIARRHDDSQMETGAHAPEWSSQGRDELSNSRARLCLTQQQYEEKVTELLEELTRMTDSLTKEKVDASEGDERHRREMEEKEVGDMQV